MNASADDFLPELPYQINDYTVSFGVHLQELKIITSDATQLADPVKLGQFFKNAQRCMGLIEKDFTSMVKSFRTELWRLQKAGSLPAAMPEIAIPPIPQPIVP
eukprot:RCo014138